MDIIFWSGGKDAYLALLTYRRRHPKAMLQLLTTFERSSGMVPHQQLPMDRIRRQAKALDLELLEVALPDDCPNEQYLQQIDRALQALPEPPGHLLFGDWYLQDIREWREEQFGRRGYSCRFPIWEQPLDTLLPRLLLHPVEVRISAVAEDWRSYIRVGEVYNMPFVRQLPDDIDPMGEKGEFHTEVIFRTPGKPPRGAAGW